MWGSREFFATTAQVLPTLLIALAVEGGLIVQQQPSRLLKQARWARRVEERQLARTGARGFIRPLWLGMFVWELRWRVINLIVTASEVPAVSAVVIVSGSFVLGEIAALAMLFLDMPALLSYLAAPVVWIAVLILTLAVIVVPISRWLGTLTPEMTGEAASTSGDDDDDVESFTP
ncbi:hypothetical protein [Nonomuraea sp. NPDC023979]|uniref:hypothetical protein n=1 Tax=Nonomuraea sp. NPDC023979 TaxID=3154796 RepID=UPI0033F35A8B